MNELLLATLIGAGSFPLALALAWMFLDSLTRLVPQAPRRGARLSLRSRAQSSAGALAPGMNR